MLLRIIEENFKNEVMAHLHAARGQNELAECAVMLRVLDVYAQEITQIPEIYGVLEEEGDLIYG